MQQSRLAGRRQRVTVSICWRDTITPVWTSQADRGTVEPVFGIIKRVMGLRQMSMRGLEKARGEWSLVTMAWNIKRLHVLQAV